MSLTLDVKAVIKDVNNNIVRSSVIRQATATLTESNSKSDIITAAASDVDITPNGLDDIDLIVIQTDQPITIKLNGTGNFAIPITPVLTESTLSRGVFVLTTTDLTSIHVSVPGATDANIDLLTGYIA